MAVKISKLVFMCANASLLFAIIAQASYLPDKPQLPGTWRDHRAPIEDRVQDLLSKLNFDEKITQLISTQADISRLGIPTFDWSSECIHGGREKVPGEPGFTMWPQPIALAATFDPQLVHEVATLISDEMRAKDNKHYKQTGQHRQLNCFGPNINIFRDPRWGRGSETYGEDPYLTSTLARAFVTGLQGQHPQYLKVSATCKHFAAYSLEEAEGDSRYSFDAKVSPRDWSDTYSPAFQACTESAAGVMCSFNSFNGIPACSSNWLLNDTLRTEWGFNGFVTSDCPGMSIIHIHHNFERDQPHSYAATVNAGTDMACPYPPTDTTDIDSLTSAARSGLISEQRLNQAVGRLMTVRFKLGQFDPPETIPWSAVSPSVVGSPQHIQKTVEAAQKGIVLLKNQPVAGSVSPVLPLPKSGVSKLVVLGPAAIHGEWLLGNYYGAVATPVMTPLQAIRNKLGDAQGDIVSWSKGVQPEGWVAYEIDNAVLACADADVAVVFVGCSAYGWYQREQKSGVIPGPASDVTTLDLIAPICEGEHRDRQTIKLPGFQEDLVKALAKRTCVPIVVVLVHGGPLDVSWMRDSHRVAAMVTTWYPGHGAQAIADVLFGDVNPSGKLPVTFYYNNYTEESSFLEMDMRKWPGRTYRFLQVPVVYPFGYGLSYTTFSYSGMAVEWDGSQFNASVVVGNTGLVSGEEVVMLFLSHASSRQLLKQTGSWQLPQRALRGFQRVSLQPGTSLLVSFILRYQDFMQGFDDEGMRLTALEGQWTATVADQRATFTVDQHVLHVLQHQQPLQSE